MPVLKTPFPATSSLASLRKPGDFLDGYSVSSNLDLKDALQAGLTMPRWAGALLDLRNRLVAPFGLKTGQDAGSAIFPVTLDTPDEINVGTDDRHLDFRIGLARKGDRIHMATWVHPHNIFGRAYLTLVMPFHILIVRDAMRRIEQAGKASM